MRHSSNTGAEGIRHTREWASRVVSFVPGDKVLPFMPSPVGVNYVHACNGKETRDIPSRNRVLKLRQRSLKRLRYSRRRDGWL